MPFTFQIQTSTPNEAFIFQTDNAVSLLIDWGDTNTQNVSGTGLRSHTYTTAGTYNISLTGTATRIAFGSTGTTPEKLYDLLTAVSEGVTGITSAAVMFAGCINITTFTATNFFDSASVNVTDMYGMFSGATNFNMSLNNWNTSKVITMALMFYNAQSFNGNISNWDTSKVTTFASMFYKNFAFNQNISAWNTSKVTNMASMFDGATNFNSNISNWNTSSVEIMNYMFRNCVNFNQPLNSWNTSEVISMRDMFNGASSFNQDISNWNVSSLTTANQMFFGVTLPTVVYDGILIKWSKQTLKPNVTISFGSSKYSEGLPLESKNLIASAYTWTITDGGSNGETYIKPKKLRCSK